MAMLGLQGIEPYFLERPVALPGVSYELREGMARIDFVMAVGAQQEKIRVVLVVGEYVGEKVEGGRVAPLEVIDKEG